MESNFFISKTPMGDVCCSIDGRIGSRPILFRWLSEKQEYLGPIKQMVLQGYLLYCNINLKGTSNFTLTGIPFCIGGSKPISFA